MRKTNTGSTAEITYLYGFVESLTKPASLSPYARLNIAFDCIEASAFDNEVLEDRRSLDHLSIVRVMTTAGRLRKLFKLNESILEGQWFRIGLSRENDKPRAWSLAAAEDYGRGVMSYNVVRLERLEEPEGKGTENRLALVSKLRAWCSTTASTQKNLSFQVPGDLYVRVLDVGHASFSAIHVEQDHSSRIVGYYDVGGPIFFHHRTFPKRFYEPGRVPQEGFVVLSHWDFDHYSLAVTKVKDLLRLSWYAPDQPVGPNAARLQSLLGKHLTLLSSPSFQIAPNLQMWRGTGVPSDRNNSGYVLTVAHPSGHTLLTGDVEYAAIPVGAKTNLIALGITHHGGSGGGSPPRPSGSFGKAALSIGVPNHYNHPDTANIGRHVSVGWHITPTFTSATQRGDVWLP